ncbi:MAG: Uma2 family endonuclease [Thermomicrobiales bacterium]
MVATKLTTVDEFMEIDVPGAADLIDGEVFVSPSNIQNSFIAVKIGGEFWTFVKPRSLGVVSGADGGYRLYRDRETVLSPDVGFFRAERLESADLDGFFPGPPDLAVEVISPSESGPMVARKVRLYLDAGCPLVWCVYRKRRTVVVHAPGAEPRTFHVGDTLDGGDVLPGFKISVAVIFE